MRTRLQLRIALEKVPRQPQAERLGIVDRIAGGQRVHGVLHRVGRQHVGVVAVGVGFVVVTLEPDRDRQIPQVVPIAVARDLDESDAVICRRPSQRACVTIPTTEQGRSNRDNLDSPTTDNTGRALTTDNTDHTDKDIFNSGRRS